MIRGQNSALSHKKREARSPHSGEKLTTQCVSEPLIITGIHVEKS